MVSSISIYNLSIIDESMLFIFPLDKIGNYPIGWRI